VKEQKKDSIDLGMEFVASIIKQIKDEKMRQTDIILMAMLRKT